MGHPQSGHEGDAKAALNHFQGHVYIADGVQGPGPDAVAVKQPVRDLAYFGTGLRDDEIQAGELFRGDPTASVSVALPLRQL